MIMASNISDQTFTEESPEAVCIGSEVRDILGCTIKLPQPSLLGGRTI